MKLMKKVKLFDELDKKEGSLGWAEMWESLQVVIIMMYRTVLYCTNCEETYNFSGYL